MTLLELAQASICGLKKKTAKEWAGPCPACGGTDRFLVWTHRDRWHCRGCNEAGDAVDFLRKFEGKKCHEAHAALGKDCDAAACQVAEKCPGGRGSGPRPVKPLRVPERKSAPEFTPAVAESPADRWRRSAEKLIERAHAELLDCPGQLAYLASRGIPREAVERYRLGWLAEDYFRPRSAWGLPAATSEKTGKPKKLWLPAGIVIPFFDAEGRPDRIRIRRPQIKDGEPRYYWVPGSGDDVPVLGRDARAFVVVESDLDAFLVHWHAGDMVGTVPLGTCSAKPKEAATEILRKALSILISLDFEPRENPRTGRHENPGGKAAQWWLRHFPRAIRWPVPAGKDPGDYVKDHGGDIRAWVSEGLPPVFRIDPVERPKEEFAKPEEKAETRQENPPAKESGLLGTYLLGKSQGGIDYLVAERREDLSLLSEMHPEAVPFTRDEIKHLKSMTPEEAHNLLLTKRVFPESQVLGTKPVFGDGRHDNVAVYDPSRARKARRGRGRAKA